MMQFPQYVNGYDAYNHEWFNQITKEFLSLQARVIHLETKYAELLTALTVKCHCGELALVGDYLCRGCRESVECTNTK